MSLDLRADRRAHLNSEEDVLCCNLGQAPPINPIIIFTFISTFIILPHKEDDPLTCEDDVHGGMH